jgi:thioredoxin 1
MSMDPMRRCIILIGNGNEKAAGICAGNACQRQHTSCADSARSSASVPLRASGPKAGSRPAIGAIDRKPPRSTFARRLSIALALLWSTGTALAAGLPYDEQANAAAEIRQAQQSARDTGRDVLMVFGANWCPECREVPRLLQQHAAQVGPDKVVLVKVDVGNFDRNLDIVRAWGNPIRKGIPAAVLYRPQQGVVYNGLLIRLLDSHARLRKIALAALVPAAALSLLLAALAIRQRREDELAERG